MKKILISVFGILISHPSFADDMPVQLTVDKINFELSAKTWVNTQTALLTVTINLSLDSSDVVKARNDLLNKLTKIASGDWHILQFDRFQDNSGLEKLSVKAQIRVNQNQLTHLYDKAKEISKPGETYQIAGIEFKPDLAEVQNAKTLLRHDLNQQIQQELAVINKTYPEQHYTISSLNYMDAQNTSAEPPMLMATGVTPRMAHPVAPVTLSNELMMTAIVEAGSVRKE